MKHKITLWITPSDPQGLLQIIVPTWNGSPATFGGDVIEVELSEADTIVANPLVRSVEALGPLVVVEEVAT